MAPSMIYHYTSGSGLIGILRSGSIYASDAEFLNDSQELWQGRQELCHALEAQLHTSGGTGTAGGHRWQLTNESIRAARMASALAYLHAHEPDRRAAMKPVYVACFSAHGDLLSQWRGYADPGGYAIGFDVAALHKCVAGDRTCTGLLEVKYEQSPVDEMVERVAAAFPDPPPQLQSRGSTAGLDGWVMANRFVLTELAAIKHSAFMEEAEWRIIAEAPEPPEAVSFRAGTTGVVGYRTINIAPAIREVIVGPGRDQENRELGVRRLLQPPGIGNHIRVHRSKAPYRT